MTGAEFSDRPLVAGSVIGLRAFATLPDGTLVSPVFRSYQWTEGENVASCEPDSLAPSAFRLAATFARILGIAAPEHELLALRCGCGFYGYTDGSNDMMRTGFWMYPVAGLIEGYGRCVVGSRGFRAEKARLVALIADQPGAQYRPRLYEGRAVLTLVRTPNGVRQINAFTPGPPDWSAIRSRYPDVPVYPTTTAALAAHPFTSTEEIR